MMPPDSANIEVLLARFPKRRPPLAPGKAAIHKALLKANRERGTPLTMLSHALESWMHRRVARYRGLSAHQRVLEIGAGTLNHVPFEDLDSVIHAVEPFEELYRDKPERTRVHAFYSDIGAIELNPTYDRIISVATLEHLTDLPFTIARAGLLLLPGGSFSNGIPSEGGFLWGLAWRATFGIAHRLLNADGNAELSWTEHMRYEHVNSAPEIIALVRHFFADVAVSRFPLPFHHLSFYAAIEARRPYAERCSAFLKSRGAWPDAELAAAMNTAATHQDCQAPKLSAS